MTKDEKEFLKSCALNAVLEVTDEVSLKELCLKKIEDECGAAIEKALIHAERSCDTARSYATLADRSLKELRNIINKNDYMLSECNSATRAMEEQIERYKTTKRAANQIVNNGVIDGFQCSECGCIVKNINIGGQWVKNVRFCPNCGGENVNYKNLKEKIF